MSTRNSPHGALSIMDMIRDTLNIDTVLLFNISLIISTVIAYIRSAWRATSSYAEDTFLSTIHIRNQDPLYYEVLRWMEDHIFASRNFRSVMAVTDYRPDISSPPPPTSPPSTFNPDEPVSYKLTDTNTSIKLNPYHGSRLFRFNNTWILFTHSTPNHNSPRSSLHSQTDPAASIKLQTLSLSHTPVRTFLQEARSYTHRVSISSITVFRAVSNARDLVLWGRVTSRPSRDISTVIFDKARKQAILRDIIEYLHPRTQQWYANHGIPYRRGYLFSGPPGTGKTSLASAIAGVFGLDIYVLSLLDPNVNESQFIRLFSEVPARCVVLLEDIDAAGLTKRAHPRPKTRINPAQDPTHDSTVAPVSYTAVSLSGLLNAIDGVSSHEGRVLIMTTNAPQDLDRALIRPGRVDMHVLFELPSREELMGLFLSMYSDVGEDGFGRGDKGGSKEGLEKGGLEEMAGRFADCLPEGRFSLAEVQGFLLRWKQMPGEACEGVEEWVREMEEHKRVE